MSEHTPGRLEVAVRVFDNDGCPETVIQGMNGAATVAVALDFGPNNPGMREANARRLVAAWNDCDGIPTDDLEACPEGGLFHLADHANRLAIEIDSLRAVNADLLGALEKARSGLSNGLWDYGPGQDEHAQCNELIEEVDAAIAKANALKGDSHEQG